MSCHFCKQFNPKNIYFRSITNVQPYIYKIKAMNAGVYIQSRDLIKYYEKWFSKNTSNLFNNAHKRIYKDKSQVTELMTFGESIYKEHGTDKWIYVGPTTLMENIPNNYDMTYHLYLSEPIPEFIYKSYPIASVCYTCDNISRNSEMQKLARSFTNSNI